jgi:hypothetical protein
MCDEGFFYNGWAGKFCFLCKYAKPTEFADSGVIWQCLKDHKTMRQFKYLLVSVFSYKISSVKAAVRKRGSYFVKIFNKLCHLYRIAQSVYCLATGCLAEVSEFESR